MSQIPTQKKAWGGVFNEPTDKRVEAFSESVSFDQRLANEDIDGSIAHAKMLAACGLMTITESEKVEQTLEEIRTEIVTGKFEFTASKEDIHLHIESALTEKLGDIGRKLHTARSRNDQVATDLRLYCHCQPTKSIYSPSRTRARSCHTCIYSSSKSSTSTCSTSTFIMV